MSARALGLKSDATLGFFSVVRNCQPVRRLPQITGGRPMQSQQALPDVSGEQRAAAELIKRIRKLRWMGFEEEAQRMVRASLHVCSNNALTVRTSEAR
jgi:hypothetical protein